LRKATRDESSPSIEQKENEKFGYPLLSLLTSAKRLHIPNKPSPAKSATTEEDDRNVS